MRKFVQSTAGRGKFLPYLSFHGSALANGLFAFVRDQSEKRRQLYEGVRDCLHLSHVQWTMALQAWLCERLQTWTDLCRQSLKSGEIQAPVPLTFLSSETIAYKIFEFISVLASKEQISRKQERILPWRKLRITTKLTSWKSSKSIVELVPLRTATMDSFLNSESSLFGPSLHKSSILFRRWDH